MKHLLLALMLALPVQAGDRQSAVGNWQGVGQQDGLTWDMELQVNEVGARVDYPGLDCGGIWIFTPKSLSIRGREWLTYGKDACLDGLLVKALPTQGGLMIRWYDANNTEIAFAPLTRVDEPVGKKGKK